MSTPGRPVQDLSWLITNFVERVPDVAHAVVVSSDGLPLAFSAGFPQERADQLETEAGDSAIGNEEACLCDVPMTQQRDDGSHDVSNDEQRADELDDYYPCGEIEKISQVGGHCFVPR